MWMLRRTLEKMATFKVLKLFLSTLSLFVCFPILIQGEVVHITVLTLGYTNVDTYSLVEYQCYPSVPDTDALLSFGRSAPITTDRSPPDEVEHPDSRNAFIRRVIFPTGDGWDRDGFGPFYCEASKPDRDVTRVTTFFQRNNNQ
ncbi:uncharacterized protein LOC115928753 [Strongylocentrotus purpuratus]|uniref:Uncharacterized protein n=1 Tax=Strongylocentrotus purpuratus TaxID=7668 RepID=A0A7M7PKJ5_STRPU|nr:uncharacterized protein LOC115928753 [Strongylocentrotus purpuratus]